MIRLVDQLSLHVARIWVTLYTTLLPLPIKCARRAEIESDLWEHVHDRALQANGHTESGLLWRVALGMPSDLSWAFSQHLRYRKDHLMDATGSRRRTHLIVIGFSVAIATLLLTLMTLGGTAAVPLAVATLTVSAVIVTRRRLTQRAPADDAAAGAVRPGRARWTQVAAVSTLVMIAVLIFGNLSEEFSGTGWAVFAGLFAVSLLSTIIAGLFLAAGTPTARTETRRLAARPYRLWLAGVAAASVVALVTLGVYAFSLEEWGEWGSVVFNGGFVLGLITTIGALVLLAIDLARPQAG